VHLRDQQLAYREDFTTGTAAAAAGGVTTVIDMPNNRPVTMDSQSLRERIQLAEKRIVINIAFNSAFPRRIAEIPRIVSEGAVGFKLYLLEQIGGVNIDDENALERAFKMIAETKVPIAVHAENKTTVEKAKKKMQSSERDDFKAFSEAHPTSAEVKAIQHVTRLAQDSEAHVHICHVSSKNGLQTIQKAKATNASITCEVTPHHLLLTTLSLKKIGNLALMLPPLRTKADTETLWEALRQGLIDTVASDHAPHSMEEKTAQSIWEVKPGIAGLETLLPLMLTEVNKNRLTIAEFVRLTSGRPAEIFHIENRGRLNEGCFADIVVVDINREYKIDASRFKSKAKFSPFDGWKVKGKPVKTFVNGQLVMDEGEIVAKPGTGRIIR
jgi:dihydroorotase (multifunctional complex type)